MPPKFQYSLKTIFVLILLAAAFFGGMSVQRRETVRALRLAEQERYRAEVAEGQARADIRIGNQQDWISLEHIESARQHGWNEHPNPLARRHSRDGLDVGPEFFRYG